MKFLFLILLFPFTARAAGKIINADIAASGTANIARNKLAASTSHNACTFDSSGFIAGGVAPGTSGNIFQSNGTDWAAAATGALSDVGTDGIIVTNGAGSVIGSGTSFAQHIADTTHNGYLSSTDWNTFNAKVSTSRAINTTAPITGGGDLSADRTIACNAASGSQAGCLSSTDWNTFNGKQAAGSYITALTGDGTASGPNSAALTLASVNGNVGSFTNASITVNAKGLVTAASSGSTSILRGFSSGLTLGNDTSTKLDISAGAATDVSQSGLMTLASTISKSTSAWAVGSGNGGLDTGSIAVSTWYWFYLIERSDTSVVDVIFSTSATNPVMPTNYNMYRKIGAMQTDGSSHWQNFIQSGNEVQWSTPVGDLNSGSITTATTTWTLSVPPARLLSFVNCNGSKAAAQPFISFKSTDMTAYGGNAFMQPAASGANAFAQLSLMTNASGQLDVKSNSSGTSVACDTYGWRWDRSSL